VTSDLRYHVEGYPIREEGGFTHRKRVNAIVGGFVRSGDDFNDRRRVLYDRKGSLMHRRGP